jgi:hypothetical protein
LQQRLHLLRHSRWAGVGETHNFRKNQSPGEGTQDFKPVQHTDGLILPRFVDNTPIIYMDLRTWQVSTQTDLHTHKFLIGWDMFIEPI